MPLNGEDWQFKRVANTSVCPNTEILSFVDVVGVRKPLKQRTSECLSSCRYLYTIFFTSGSFSLTLEATKGEAKNGNYIRICKMLN